MDKVNMIEEILTIAIIVACGSLIFAMVGCVSSARHTELKNDCLNLARQCDEALNEADQAINQYIKRLKKCEGHSF